MPAQSDEASHIEIGGKAKNLIELSNLGANVPPWTVIPAEVLLKQVPAQAEAEGLKNIFQNLAVPEHVMSHIKEFFGEDYESKHYAVRSSALDEDGAQFSFAGQFETFLYVGFSDIEDKIKAVWASVISTRVTTYRAQNNLPSQLGIGVIIQEMISSDVAGVAFGMDPVTGALDNKVISAVYGLGEGLVSGELDADTFTLAGDGLKEVLADKTYAFVGNSSRSGIEKIKVEGDRQNKPTLLKAQIDEIAELLDKLNNHFGAPQDIEFTYHNSTLYLLQTRPITTHNKLKGEYILWDNSNIIESYPGVTTPLTYSFVSKMYERVYRQLAGIMGVNSQEIKSHSEIFANTLGLVRGRVYYNLLNWYKMLAMVPGYSINAENMERMMGVKERFDLGDQFKMNKQLARLRVVGMAFRMIWLQIGLPRQRTLFQNHLDNVMKQYTAIDFNDLSAAQIITHYKAFEKTLLLKWKAPLVNDFFAMIWFGMLQKKVEQYCPEHPNIQNDLLCGSQDIISVEPIHRSIDLAKMVSEDKDARRLFESNTPDVIWKLLCRGEFPDIKAGFDSYLELFGNRCVGELKLETISYAQEPSLFVKVIKSYVNQGIIALKAHSNIEEELRIAAEKQVFGALKGQPVQKWWTRYLIHKTRDLVSSRENLRYERTRGFGMVRTMFIALGLCWLKEGYLADPRDVFYLKLSEIKASANTGLSNALLAKIQLRKEKFSGFKKQEPPQERFFTYGNNFTDDYIYSSEKIEGIEKELNGIGCCPGTVKGKVRVVLDPTEIDSLAGDILVTTSTDPGWVTLFPTASGIIVERGSLLSHSAIVSREMGLPCIVSVSGLLRSLKSGDEVIMDGATGEIRLIEDETTA